MTKPPQSVLYVAGAVVQGLALVLVLPFATRTLGVVEYGRISVAVAIVQVVVMVSAAGLPLAVTRAWFDSGDGPDRARAIAGLVSLLSIAVGLCGAVVVWWATGWRHAGIITALAFVASGALGSVAAGQALLRAQLRAGWFVVLGVGSSLGAHAFALLAAVVIRPDSVTYLLGFTVAIVAVAVLSHLITRPRLPWRVPGAASEGWRIGLPVLPHSMGLLLLTSGAVLLLAHVSSSALAGRYQAVLALAQGPLALLAALNNSWVPAVLGVAESARALQLRMLAPTIVRWGAALACLATGAASLATYVVVGEDFAPVELVPVAQVLPLVAVGYALYLAASIVLFAEKRTASLAVVTPLITVLTALVAYPLAVSGSVTSVALAQVLGFAALGLGTLIAASRVQHLGWPWRSIAWPSAGAAAMVVTMLALPRGVPWAVGEATATAAAFAVVGAGALRRHRQRMPFEGLAHQKTV